jgi:plasmid stabilization system protein ParE
MAFTVELLDWVEADIADKIRYLKQEWGIAIAKMAYTELMDKLALLATQPRMGAPIPELIALGHSDYLVLTHDTHTKIIYHVDEAQEVITIHMVYGSRQNFQDLLYKRIIRYL